MKTNPTWALTVAAIKMWSRDRAALVWNFVFPVMLMSILGVLNFGAFGRVDVGAVDQAGNPASRALLQRLDAIEALNVSQRPSVEGERRALIEGDRDLVMVLPAGFGEAREDSEVKILYNEGRPREVQLAQTIIREALDEMTLESAGVSRLFSLTAESVTNRSFSYIDFLLPGVVAMSIMQLGMFNVAFGFIAMRKQGILRRLWATPVHPSSFLFGQVITRLIVSVLQTILLISTAVVFFDAQVAGNIGAMLVLAIVGAAVFLCMGFAIAGWAKNENVAAPIANLISMPLIFLSGVFFGREFLPDVLQTITAYSPLTYLADGLRNISSEGATLWSQSTNLLGLGVWLILSFALATRVFRWE